MVTRDPGMGSIGIQLVLLNVPSTFYVHMSTLRTVGAWTLDQLFNGQHVCHILNSIQSDACVCGNGYWTKVTNQNRRLKVILKSTHLSKRAW